MKRAAASFLEFAGLTLIVAVLTAFAITFAAMAVVVQGSSMEPALHDGERVLVNKLVYRLRPTRRGEIIVFRHGPGPGRMLIKRVIGLPQEQLAISGGLVYVNGAALGESYILERSAHDHGPVYVPCGHLFVLGDNRNHSQDSADAALGMAPIGSVEGKAFVVYWPLTRARVCKDPRYPEEPESASTAAANQVPSCGATCVSGVP
jgi:signal peptidase I